MLQIGDLVEWESHAGSARTVKRGEVAAVIPPDTKPGQALLEELERKGFNITKVKRNIGQSMARRSETSYIVSVPQGGKQRPILYWPIASWLKRVETLFDNQVQEGEHKC